MKQALLRWLRAKALDRLEVTDWKPDFIIGKPEAPYVHRWYVIPRNPFMNIYAHKFLRSDQDFALHSHPWLWNFSLLWEGCYNELVPNRKIRNLREACQSPEYVLRQEGDICFRWGASFHRVELLSDFAGYPIPVWTIFVTGPKIPEWIREWGFMCKSGFIPFRKMTKYVPGKGSSPREEGCPE